MNKKFTLRTNLDIEKCLMKLSEEINTNNIDSIFAGKIYNRELWIYTKKGYNSNGFLPIFEGKLRETEQGILIEGRFRWRTITRFVVISVLGILIFMSIVAMNILPLLFIIPLLIITLIGYGLGKSDENDILSMLRKALDVKD